MEEGGRKGDRESGSHAKSHATSHMPTMLTRAHGKVERGFEVKQVGQEAGPDNKGRREGKGREGEGDQEVRQRLESCRDLDEFPWMKLPWLVPSMPSPDSATSA